MAGPLLYDRVLETTTTTGTSTLTLTGAVTGHQSFAAVGDGNTCPFCVYAVDGDGNPSGDWEVSIGAYTSAGTTLSRTTVLASSNSNNAVNFGAGTKRVALVLPAAFAGQYLHPTNTFASLVAAQAGRVLFPSDGFGLYRDTGSVLVPWGPLFPFTSPVDGDFAWVNQAFSTVSTVNGGVYLAADNDSGGLDLKIRKKAAPPTPYTISAAIIHNQSPGLSNSMFGLCFRESSSGKLSVIRWITSGSLLASKYNSPTSFSANYDSDACYAPPLFLRIADNGTSRIYSYSYDGQNYLKFHTVGRTDFHTADEVGWFVAGPFGDPSGEVGGALLLSWREG